MKVHYTSQRTGTGRDDWRTPRWLFDRMNREHGFALDAAATQENKLCQWWLGTGSDLGEDALSADWAKASSGLSIWLNPPYSKLRRFLTKAAVEAMTHKIRSIVCLIPARTDTRAWHECVMRGATEVFLIKGRLRFSESNDNAPFPSAVVVYGDYFPDAPRFYSMEQDRD